MKRKTIPVCVTAVEAQATTLDDELPSTAHEFADKLITFLLVAENVNKKYESVHLFIGLTAEQKQTAAPETILLCFNVCK